MKKLVMILALSCAGMFANAETTALQPAGGESHIAGGAWVCGLAFKGTSKGIKVIVGHFKTVAYGTLSCKGVGQKYHQDVKIEIGHHWIGATAGIGYFKLAGVSSEISLFNSSPEVLLGKYAVAQGEAAIIGGVGAFTAVKVGLPQLAFNVSVQLLKGLGVQVGIDKLTISAID
ncbi:MAG: hypothetical protein OM95_13385 [Bdellovibrio sp. ArHS]|uniref:hypothetical protein n=1 Tax=Bdellovibrio sp. ArHS TaxID=1569284 RepID=UPI000583EC17|nr:hypothetical protein [Bdellovibrio sp. ArHS]KHD87582.1 MAG: hypothetical protein OM95_13385 [Bdellovibrio sp. ArHS]